MTKVLNASCELDIVTAEGVPVPDATILSQGTKSSDGILVMDEDQSTYVTSNAEDLSDTIDKLSDILNNLSDLVASIVNDTIFIPGTGGASLIFPPSFAASKASIDAAITELDAMKEMLK